LFAESNGNSVNTLASPPRRQPSPGKKKQHKAAPRDLETSDEMEALLEGFQDLGCEEASAAAAMFLSARVHTKEKPGGGPDRGSCSSPHSHSTCAEAHRTWRKEPNQVCPFGGDMSRAVELRCGHQFSLEHLQEAQNRAKFSDKSGVALLCPLCGDQHRYRLDQPEPKAAEDPSQPQPKLGGVGKSYLSIYSNCTDAYMGNLRQDFTRPLGLPRQLQPKFLSEGKDGWATTGFR